MVGLELLEFGRESFGIEFKDAFNSKKPFGGIRTKLFKIVPLYFSNGLIKVVINFHRLIWRLNFKILTILREIETIQGFLLRHLLDLSVNTKL